MTVIVFVYDTSLIGEIALFLAKIRYCQKVLTFSHRTTKGPCDAFRHKGLKRAN